MHLFDLEKSRGLVVLVVASIGRVFVILVVVLVHIPLVVASVSMSLDGEVRSSKSGGHSILA